MAGEIELAVGRDLVGQLGFDKNGLFGRNYSGRYVSATPSSITGIATQKCLSVVTIPKELIRPFTYIEIDALWKIVGSNNKTYQILIGEGGAGYESMSYIYNAADVSFAGTLHCRSALLIGAEVSQQIAGINNSVSGLGNHTSPPVELNKSLDVGMDVGFAAKLSNAADSVTLLGYSIRIDS